MTLRSFLWLAPFVLFLAGYYITYRLVLNEVFEVPSVIGKSTHEALQLFSHARLNARIVAEKEDASLQPGIIISQNPQPLQRVKPQQSVFLVVSKKPPVIGAPSFLACTEQEACVVAEKKSIILKKIFLPSNAPKGICLAQIPAPGATLSSSPCTVYISAGIDPYRIMPDCTGLPVHDVASFFKDIGAALEVFHDYQPEGHRCIECTVKDQRPLPGTCIDISRPLLVQLSAE